MRIPPGYLIHVSRRSQTPNYHDAQSELSDISHLDLILSTSEIAVPATFHAMTAFIPRPSFPQLDSLVRSYFLGHHRAALTEMSQMLSSVELIIECRDHRVPLSSRNPMFEKALSGRERLMVYTKKDLAQGTLNITVGWYSS